MNLNDRTLSLAGTWAFALGSPDDPSDACDEPSLPLCDTVRLPGTTCTNEKGPENADRTAQRLSQPHLFVGPCWYGREVEIPEEWRGKRATLLLERTKFTRVWFDGHLIGEQPWICTPHEYVLTESAIPGRHRLTVLVDNRRLPPYGSDAHQVSDNTQGNWNGIIGRIEIRAADRISIRDLRVYPNAARQTVDIALSIRNAGVAIRARLRVQAVGGGVSGDADCIETFDAAPGEQTMRITVPLGPDAALWDEFRPNLIRAEALLTAEGSEDRREVRFGLRDFRAVGRHFEVNGKPIFLRGRHDGCVFPLTGHPPMDRTGWLAYFRTCREYGLNHVRFHTWTPPEAAFDAADELGFYLQPELPFWGDFTQEAFDALLPEAERILRSYGNHPSFVMFSLGNEHAGGEERLDEVVRRLKNGDGRRLYVRGTCAFWWNGRPGPYDDYWIAGDAKSPEGESFQIRGANLAPWGHVQRAEANTLTDYRKGAEANDVPTVSHEIGQYTVYPDFSQIAKYTGVAKPYNLIAFRDKLDAAGMLDQDRAFAAASGALSALCYRAEIEACLRTPEYGGFEILDLQDFPGQGTALVGMLDAFMDSKGILEPAAWRCFCSPVTLLARFAKYVWTSGEVFQAGIAVSHFGPEDLAAGQLSWSLTDESGGAVSSGVVPHPVLQAGGLRDVCVLDIPLAAAGRFTLELRVEDADIATTYPLWVFASQEDDLDVPHDLVVARGHDRRIGESLAQGRRVLLVCDGRPLARSVGGGFASDFWNFPMFHGTPGTMGLLCDPKAPALAGFPNEGRSDWQWASIAMAAQPLILDGILARGEIPIVQVIDNYARCHKLGMIFELRVGTGRLLVCASDLIGLQADHPEARALLRSLIGYASSDLFCPAVGISDEAIADLLRARLATTGWSVTASSFDRHWHGYQPEQIVDGSESRGWRAAEPGPAWCRIEFPGPTNLGEGEIVFAPNSASVAYALCGTSDGVAWTTLCEGRFDAASGHRRGLSLKMSAATAVRLSVEPVEPDGVAEVMELHLFDPAYGTAVALDGMDAPKG